MPCNPARMRASDDVLGIHDRYAEEAAGGVVIGEPETRHDPKSSRAAGCRKPLQGGGEGTLFPFERVSARCLSTYGAAGAAMPLRALRFLVRHAFVLARLRD
jgi:hypothetical protein